MINESRKLHSLRTALGAALLVSVASGALGAESAPKHYFDVTGTVRDVDTWQPIEGAYVVASYKKVRSGLAATVGYCVKTLGMYTGRDGVYHFPVEKRDGRNPFDTNAIKDGYYWKKSTRPNSETDVWRKQRPEGYQNWDIYLQKQDPAHPSFRFSDGQEKCWEPEGTAAASAGIEFTKLRLDQVRAYGTKDGVQTVEGQLQLLIKTADESEGKRLK